jgi:hypothetical protein
MIPFIGDIHVEPISHSKLCILCSRLAGIGDVVDSEVELLTFLSVVARDTLRPSRRFEYYPLPTLYIETYLNKGGTYE